MQLYGLLPRLLRLILAIVGMALGIIGCLALGGPGRMAALLVAVLGGVIAAVVLHESPSHDRRAVVEAAVTVVGGVAAAIVIVVGLGTTAGPTVASLVVVAVMGWGLARAVRVGRRDPARTGHPVGPSDGGAAAVQHLTTTQPGGTTQPGAMVSGGPVPGGAAPAVLTGLSTPALGREWLRTTAALTGRLDPGGRRAVVERRQATLDELERRDPAGFARWLAAGPEAGSDPADFVREDPAAGTAAA